MKPVQPPVTPPRPSSGSQQLVDSETDPVDDTLPDTDAGPTDELISHIKTYSYDLAGNRTGFPLQKGSETMQDAAYKPILPAKSPVMPMTVWAD